MLDGVQANHLTVKSLTFCRVRTKNLHECYWIFFSCWCVSNTNSCAVVKQKIKQKLHVTFKRSSGIKISGVFSLFYSDKIIKRIALISHQISK